MKISVIIPVYNTEKYLKQCVDSVLNQSYSDIEVILVDDGSPDNSPAICDNYQQKDTRVKVIHKKNGGLSDARNEGLKIASGEYIVFLDSDDYYIDNNAIKNWVVRIKKMHPDVLIFRSKKYYQNTDTYDKVTRINVNCSTVYEGKEILTLMKQGLFRICAWDKVVSKKFLEENDINFVFKQRSEDMEWCIKLLMSNVRICFDAECYHAYRQQNTLSLSANISNEVVDDISSVVMRYAANKKQLSTNQILVNHLVANIYVQWMNISNRVPKKSIDDLLKQMSKYQYILQYNAYPYVRIASKFKFLGFSVLRKLIYFYYRMKNRKL